MATNPMQRKARNSFLLGMLITTIIAAIIIAILLLQFMNLKKSQESVDKTIKQVYVLQTDTTSGTEISQENLVIKNVATDILASNVLTPSDFQEINSNDEVITKKLLAKINLVSGTILTKDMVMDSEFKITSDVRLQEYNSILLPSKLEKDSYVDIRLLLPNGQDVIVVSKKQVMDISTDTIWINATEEEIVTLSNAIVESYIMTGSKLYATPYVEPGIQTSATPTYIPSAEVVQLMNIDSNIQNTAKAALAERIQNGNKIRTDYINPQINNYSENATENIETNMKTEIEKQKENREQYFAEMEASQYTLE